MTVSNPAEFVKDPNVTAAVAEGIATALNVPGNWVNVTLTVVPARRLLGTTGRMLEGTGTVQVDYVITIPGVTPVVGVTSPSNVSATLSAGDASAFQAAISNSVAQKAGPAAYSVQVTSIEITTSAPTSAPTPPPTPAPRGLPPNVNNQDDDDDSSARNIGIIVGVFVALFLLAVCCLCALVCMYTPMWNMLPQAMGGGGQPWSMQAMGGAGQQQGQAQGDMLLVMPAPGPAPALAANNERWANPPLPASVIPCIVKMRVSNPAEFGNEPSMHSTVAEGIATALDVPGSWVNVTRMDRDPGSPDTPVEPQPLLQVHYLVKVPSDTPAANARSPSNIRARLAAAGICQAFQAAISNSVAVGVPKPEPYSVEVTSHDIINGSDDLPGAVPLLDS